MFNKVVSKKTEYNRMYQSSESYFNHYFKRNDAPLVGEHVKILHITNSNDYSCRYIINTKTEHIYLDKNDSRSVFIDYNYSSNKLTLTYFCKVAMKNKKYVLDQMAIVNDRIMVFKGNVDTGLDPFYIELRYEKVEVEVESELTRDEIKKKIHELVDKL